MKSYLLFIFLTLTLFLNINAQDSEEISQLTPIRKLTKAELKKLDKLINKAGWKGIICVVGSNLEETDVSIGVENKILANGKKISVIKAEINSYSLYFKKIENDESVASMNFFVKITSDEESLNGTFEEAVTFNLKKEQLDKPKSLFYQKNFELPKGKYTLKFIARDTQTGVGGYRSVKFEVN